MTESFLTKWERVIKGTKMPQGMKPTEQEIAAVQEQFNCNHMTKLGKPCDEHSGGWWDCGCAVTASSRKHGRFKEWKWMCRSCGVLTNDGECDCTKNADTAKLQVLIRNP